MDDDISPAFEALLEYLKRTRGIDLTGYKRSSLLRRINKRMQTLEIENYADYQDSLEVHPEEFAYLFNTLLINVTSFFRDRPAWDFIRENVIPQIITRKESYEPIRIWTAGCASGEETYTLAMLLAEALGIEQFRTRVKIYATDLDEEALSQARAASYEPRQVSSIPEEFLSKYFEQVDDRYLFVKDLRRMVIFGRHNLVQDAPISHTDLLICRNTLMYLNAETQAKIIARFHFALAEDGFLFLGKAETLLSQNSSFTPINLKQRIFVKTRTVNFERSLSGRVKNTERANSMANQSRACEAAFDAAPIAQIVVDLNGNLVLANDRSRTLFGLTQRDVGRPLQDLELSYRPVELRSCIDQAYAERRSIVLRDVVWTVGTIQVVLEVQISLLSEATGALLGASIAFSDMSRYKQLQQDLEHSNQELEMAYEELQSANEELETTNEELQSTIEELETTNEELQSTNEELETMNEELQSTNEELHSINEEVHRRTEEADQLNLFLESILASFDKGVVVLDTNFYVKVWNQESEELWGLRSSEVRGQHFLSLDIGLPVEQLRQLIRNCLTQDSNHQEVMLQANNRRGRSIDCKVTCTALQKTGSEISGVILMMEPQAIASSPQ